MADAYFTLVFEGDIRERAFNPLKAETPFGRPVAVGVGDAFERIDSLERGGEIARLILMDTLNGIETHFGKEGLDKVVEHAKAANKARERNAEIDEIEATLPAGLGSVPP
jgi:hypothetical protein